jgi:Tol biopolymer transport system component/DNA-binding winged helix-turn-helix (wHTH) protein
MHHGEAPPTVFRFGPFTLDGRSGELRKGPTRLRVPDQSIAILRELLQSPGELVTREALRDRLWPPHTHVDFEAGLNAAVRRLREALGDSADAPRYVETLPRRGYRFIAALDGLPAAAALAPAASAGGDVPVVARPEGARGARVRNVTLAVMVLTLLAAGAWVALRRNDAAPTASGLAKPVPITSFPGLEITPAISPAGNLVAFAWDGDRGNNFDIYVRSLDGRSQVQLTSDAASDHLPAWSPDGQRIAFVRVLSGRRVIMEVPALGGPEQALFEAGPPERQALAFGGAAGGSYGLSWTPDGGHLLFGDRNASAFAAAIYQYSLEDGQRRQLTSPPANHSDGWPIVSPDGRYLAFVRRNDAHFGGSVFVQKFDPLHAGGDPVQLTYGHLVRTFDWTADSRSIIHDSWWENGLWRTGVGGGRSEPVLPNILAVSPSVARSGPGLVYQNSLLDPNIWELPTPPSPTLEPSGDATFRVIASTSIDQDPQFSPDGARIAFASARSGHRQLWVANRDGSGAKPLTSFADGRVGSPSWSADGQWIAFDAIRSDVWNLCIVPANGGIIRTLIADDAFNNIRPSWSRDGRWIYFGSDRTGNWQIWKVPVAGGTPEQVTRGGGIEPVVSPDGRRVYYAKPPPEQGIWEIPAEGGDEVRIVDRGRALSFDVADTGIFMLDVSTKPQATVEMFSFSSRQLTTVARLPPGLRFSSSAPYLRVTRDGTAMLYVRFDQWHSDIHMLPGFR